VAGGVTTLIPVVSRVHFDDILNLFTLKITFLLKTPLGNQRKEVTFDAGSLLEALQILAEVWSGQGVLQEDLRLGYVMGSASSLQALIAQMQLYDNYNPQTLPDPPAGLLDEPDSPWPADPYEP